MLLVRKRNSLAGSAVPGVSPSTPAQAPAQPDIPQRYRIRREWVKSHLRTLQPHRKAFSGGDHQELTPLLQCPPCGEALTALGPDKPCRKGTCPTPEQRKDGKRNPGTHSRDGAPVPPKLGGCGFTLHNSFASHPEQLPELSLLLHIPAHGRSLSLPAVGGRRAAFL